MEHLVHLWQVQASSLERTEHSSGMLDGLNTHVKLYGVSLRADGLPYWVLSAS